MVSAVLSAPSVSAAGIDLALSAAGLGYGVGGKTLLDNVSVRVHPGKLVAIVGPNGAGKSTLLRLLSGELTPTRGEVRLANRPWLQWDRRKRARALAVLPQQSAPAFPISAFEVVLLGRAPHVQHRETARDLAIAHAALTATDAAHLAARLYPSLSGGEKSRVQTARVLAQIWEPVADGTTPRFLLLDEPTAALDCAHQHRLLGFARDFARRGDAGVLVVLHDLNLAAAYADEIILLHAGRVRAVGSPETVLTPAAMEAVYGVPMITVPHPQTGRPLLVVASSPDGDGEREPWTSATKR